VEEIALSAKPANMVASPLASPDQCYDAHTRYVGRSWTLAMQSELTGMDIDTHADGDPRLERHIVGIGYDFATASARATNQHRIHQ
jgi:hypothetical protein